MALALACAAGCHGDDEDAPASCDGCECEDYCIELCQYAAAECGGFSVKDCTLGCFDFEPTTCATAPVEGRSCEYLEQEAGCYEVIGNGRGDCFATDCLETGDCEPTQECLDNICRERCSESVPCASGRDCTYEGVCSDPIGKTCDPDAYDFETCFGGECVDENASLETVEPYCTLSCSTLQATCPGNYVCQDGKCLER